MHQFSGNSSLFQGTIRIGILTTEFRFGDVIFYTTKIAFRVLKRMIYSNFFDIL